VNAGDRDIDTAPLGRDGAGVSDSETLIAQLEAQERELVFTRFDNDDALSLGERLVARAREQGLAVTIDIRRGGQQLFHAALAGTAPDNDRWIERKVRVVERFQASSFLVGRRFEARGDVLDERHGVDPALYATHGGSFPVRVRDVGVVGAITVSGLPQAEDHALVVAVIGEFLAAQ
jgi:uncharacterized protein (UPF0303 family)